MYHKGSKCDLTFADQPWVSFPLIKLENVNNLAQELAGDLSILSATRTNMLQLLENCSLEQVNRIPSGFNNNLAWNAAHCLVTQKLLTYGLSGHDTGLSAEMVAAYRKGSKPMGDVSAAEWASILEQLKTSPAQMEKDLVDLTWDEHKPYTTSYGVTISHVRKGLCFNNTHEGTHFGTMMALKRLV